MKQQQQNLYVGVDMAKSTFVAAWACGGQAEVLGEFSNTPAGYQELARVLERLCAGKRHCHLIVEPTGGYEQGILAYGYQMKWTMSRVNPFRVRRWAQGVGQRGKTDRLDARMLACFGQATTPRSQSLLQAEADELEALIRRKEDLEKLLRAEENRLAQLAQRTRVCEAVQESLEQMIKTLKQQLEAIEQAIHQLFRTAPMLAAQRRHLLTIPGIGPKTVDQTLLLCHRFDALTNGEGTAKQIVAFVGLDPKPFESGKSIHRRAAISKMGDQAGRTRLYLSALGAVRGKNSLNVFYHQLRERGKPGKVALIACARKILVWAWTIFQNHTPFDHSRHPLPAA
jgi:transposase